VKELLDFAYALFPNATGIWRLGEEVPDWMCEYGEIDRRRRRRSSTSA